MLITSAKKIFYCQSFIVYLLCQSNKDGTVRNKEAGGILRPTPDLASC